MTQIKCDVAIIGAGTAGLEARRVLEARGRHAVVVERGPGGTTCASVGCMPSKLLLAAGRAADRARRSDLFGVRTGAVEVDGPAVMARLRAERDRFAAGARRGWQEMPNDCRVQGKARFAGPTTLAVEGGPTIEAGAVVIAVGSRPVVPPVLDAVRTHVHTYETIFEIPDLPRRLLVLGAGALGLELAQAFSWLGVQVTVVDGGTTVSKLTDPVAAEAARAALADVFDLKLEAELEGAEMAGDAVRARWTGGGGEFDMVLAASGVKPELEPLGLEAAGLELDDHGTPVFDPHTRRCGGSDVFIAGDASPDRPVLHEARLEGEAAGVSVAGGDPDPRPPMLSMTFTEPGIVFVGCDHDDLPPGHRIGTADFAGNGRVRIDEGPDMGGVARVYADADGRLIGGTIVGPGAEHAGHLLAFAVARGLTAAEFDDLPLYHPTVEEVLRNAVRELTPPLECGRS